MSELNYRFYPLAPEDKSQVMEIFNYYGENTFAAYHEEKVPEQFFDAMYNMTRNHPTVTAKDENGRLLGFGFLRGYHIFSTFSHTAEISYFLRPEATGQGIGGKMLEYLIAEGKKQGITNILASISSENPGSVKFHVKHGFTECGRLKKVCRKRGQYLDQVWMQKLLD